MSFHAGTGQFTAWDGGCLFIGRHTSELPVHSHQAIQLVVASNADFFVRSAEAEPWQSYSAALIPSHQPHGLNVTAADYGAVIFIEPETREGRAMTQSYLQNGVAEVGSGALTTAARAMFNAWIGGQDLAVVTAGARSLVQILAQGMEPPIVTDQRILKAIDYIGAHLDESITLEAVASHACLSPSRFRHLFVEETGMGLRPYVLWRRFLRVWSLLMAGESLSSAAHMAGFADAAHLSRTSKRAFGFAPSAIDVRPSLPAPVVTRR